jgi:hypothetical protein
MVDTDPRGSTWPAMMFWRYARLNCIGCNQILIGVSELADVTLVPKGELA